MFSKSILGREVTYLFVRAKVVFIPLDNERVHLVQEMPQGPKDRWTSFISTGLSYSSQGLADFYIFHGVLISQDWQGFPWDWRPTQGCFLVGEFVSMNGQSSYQNESTSLSPTLGWVRGWVDGSFSGIRRQEAPPCPFSAHVLSLLFPAAVCPFSSHLDGDCGWPWGTYDSRLGGSEQQKWDSGWELSKMTRNVRLRLLRACNWNQTVGTQNVYQQIKGANWAKMRGTGVGSVAMIFPRCQK